MYITYTSYIGSIYIPFSRWDRMLPSFPGGLTGQNLDFCSAGRNGAGIHIYISRRAGAKQDGVETDLFSAGPDVVFCGT